MTRVPDPSPVLEFVDLKVDATAVEAFILRALEARHYLLGCQGLLRLGLDRCMDHADRFALRLEWRDVADMERFRASPDHAGFRNLMDRFVVAAQVHHFTAVPGFAAPVGRHGTRRRHSTNRKPGLYT